MERTIVNPTETFELEIFGTSEIIQPSDYYLLQEDGKIILKHNKLVELSDKHKVKVDKTILEYGIFNNNDNFYFTHRSYGTTSNGDVIDEVGDASPTNCNTSIAKSIPAVMSDKRSKDKLLIRLLGIRDKVYSDCEIENLPHNNKVPTLISTLENAKSQEERLKIAEEAIIDFGKYKNNKITVKEAMQLYMKRKDENS